MTEHDGDLIAAEYVLGLLNDADAAAFEKRLNDEPALRDACLHWYEEFALLHEQTEATAPPAELKAKIHARLFAEQSDESKKPFWLWPASLVSGLLLATLIGIFYQQSQLTPFQADYTASLTTDDSSLRVVASYDQTQNLLQVSSIKATPAEGRSHELWLIAANAAPVSLGLLRNIASESIVLPESLSSVIIGSTLAISDEPAGGSPTGSPTGAVLTTALVVSSVGT